MTSPSCPRCHTTGIGDVVTDGLTGTAYERCRACGAHWRLSPGGWLDWHGGLWLESKAVTGSAWTSQPSPELMPEVSRWTNKTPKPD